jgi:Leucine-rich repeat (LRR) protein
MSSPSDTPTTPPRSKRRWWRFSLRTLLIFVTLFCVSVGWFLLRLHRAERQRIAVANLKEAHFGVHYDWELNYDVTGNQAPELAGPGWLRNWLGNDFFDDVVDVSSPLDRPERNAIRDDEFQWVFSLPKLRFLNIHDLSITDASITKLHELKDLENLFVSDPRMDDSWMQGIGTCTHLKKLVLIESSRVTEPGFANLAPLVDLEQLLLPDGGDAALRAIANLKRLRILLLTSKKVTDSGAKALASLPLLETLILNRTSIGDEGVKSLAKLKRLEDLRLTGTAIGDDGIRNFDSQTQIKDLEISFTKVGDSSMRFIRNWESLQSLRASNTNIGDEGLKSIAGLKELRYLNLASTKVSDKGLKFIVGLKNLRDLNLASTKISDEGLKLIAQLSNLEDVDIGGTAVTRTGANWLHKALPKTAIMCDDSYIEPEKESQ